jgi:HEAT repeat protein
MWVAKPNISRMESKRDVDGLVRALAYRDADIRQSAASALDKLAWAPRDDMERVRYLIARQAWQELVQAGSPAVEPLIDMLKDEDQDIVKGARMALEELAHESPDVVIGPMVRALEDSSWFLAAEILGATGDPRAIEPLIGALRHEQFLTVERPDGTIEPFGVVKNLVSFGQPAVGPLIRALQISDPRIQGAAALALGLIGDPTSAGPLAEALGKSDPWASRPHVAKALQLIGEPAVAPLIQVLGHAEPSVRAEAARILGEIGDPRATEALAYALGDGAVARTAAKALAEVGDPRGVMYFVLHRTNVADDNWTGAIEAARKIGKLAVGPLVGALGSENDLVRICAADALAAIGPDAYEAVPALIQGLRDKAGGMRMEAAQALGKVGPKAMVAVPHLIQTMGQGPVAGFLERGAAWNALKAITGQDLPRDVAAWQKWWAGWIQQSGCPQCGCAVKAGVRFCTNCGTRLV